MNLLRRIIPFLIFLLSSVLFFEMLKIEKTLSEQNHNPHLANEYIKNVGEVYLADLPRDHAYIRGLDIDNYLDKKDVKIAENLSYYIINGRNYIIMMRYYKDRDEILYGYWKGKFDSLFHAKARDILMKEIDKKSTK